MSIQHFKSAARKTINWASGTSTELFIYPADGDFAKRDFLFRISKATVEADESDFTFFEGITRHLMILRGKLELIHEGRYTKHLDTYDQDVFSGEWKTRSKGRVTDFNLMLKQGASGTLAHQSVSSGQAQTFCAEGDFFFIYLAAGTATTDTGSSISSGDLLRLAKDFRLTLTATEQCELVIVQVSLKDE